MEIKSVNSYLMELISKFDYSDFSPESSKEIPEKFKKIFYQETPYWKPTNYDGTTLYVEFKKYGNNRKIIILKFLFRQRDLTLQLTNEDLKNINNNDERELQFSDIWKNHLVLFESLKEIVDIGLSLAEETNQLC